MLEFKYVGGNQRGIGVEIANAYYTKYQDWYVKNGFGERPVVESAEVHGKHRAIFRILSMFN